MKVLSEKLDALVSNLEKVLNENKRNKSIEEFDGDCSNMLDMAKDCVTLYKKFCNYHQEISARLSVSNNKLHDVENKLLEMEQKSKILKKDLIKTCKCIEDFEENEIKFKEKITNLENKLASLEEEKDVTIPGTEAIIDTDSDREKKLLNSRLSHLEANLKLKEESEQEMKAKLIDTVTAVERLEQHVEELRIKLKDELERSKKAVKDKVYIERDSRDKDTKIKELEEEIVVFEKKLEEVNFTNEVLKRKITFYLSRISTMKENYLKAEKEATHQMRSYKSLSDERNNISLLLEKKDEDIKALNQKLINVMNTKESYLQKCLRIQSQKQSSDERAKHLKLESMNLEKEIVKMKKQISQHDAEVANLTREKELLAKNIIKMESLMKKYEDDFKNSENEKIGLHRDLRSSKLEIEKQNNVISALESLKSQLVSDIKCLTKKIETLNDELSSHEDKENTMELQIAELTSKLSQQIHISNAAILDRKMFCQQYKEMKENRDEMKQKIDNLDNYVNELKEILCNRNKEIKEWKSRFERLDLQNRKINSQLAGKKSEFDILKHENKHLDELLNGHLQSNSKKDKEVDVLNAKVNELSEECKKLNSKVHQQIIDIESLEEKLKISEKNVEAEKEKYLNFQNSAKFFQLEIVRLTSEKNSLVSRINDLEKLKRSFVYAKEELDKERFKNSALERAMQQPINVHRWRLLKGRDPEKHELIENCQATQKQLLKKCAESEEKDKKLSHMNRLVQQLKTMTLRQKDLEEKYMKDARLKIQLKGKTDEIKALKFETSMYESYMNSCQAEIKHLHNELEKLKTKQFLRQKSKVSPEKEDPKSDKLRE